MRKEFEEKTIERLDLLDESSFDSIDMIIEQLKINNRLWIVKKLNEYGKKWDAMHKKWKIQ